MTRRLAVVLASVVFVACSGRGTSTGGGDGTGGGDSGGGSGSSSSSGGGSSSGSASGSSGGSSGGGGSSSGSSGGMSSGGSGGSSGAGSSSGSGSSSGGSSSGCFHPSDCPGQVCCATVPVTGGSVPNCTTGTLTAVCKPASACPTVISGFTCSGTEQLQLCSGAGQCNNAGQGNTSCCTFTNDAGALSFCTSSLAGAVGGGTCM